MSVRNVLTVNAIYIALIALTGIFAPAFLLETTGLEVNDVTISLERSIGAVIVAYAIASWLMRDAPASQARRAFLIGGGVGYLVVAVVFVINALAGLGNAVMWVFIVVSALLGAAFMTSIPKSE